MNSAQLLPGVPVAAKIVTRYRSNAPSRLNFRGKVEQTMTNHSPISRITRRGVLKTGAVAAGVGALSHPVVANRGSTVHMADVVGQGDTFENAARLRRTKHGISFQVSMPTPEDYNVPEYDPEEDPFTSGEEGHPDVFTLWVFIIDDDLFGDMPWSTVFNGAGHPVGGPHLDLSGSVSTNHEPFAGLDFENPNAAVHLAVAPHGELDPALMPEQATTPAGDPSYWWVAQFPAI